METYDIYFKEGNDFANKGFSLKDKAKACLLYTSPSPRDRSLRPLEWRKICWLNAKDM